MSEKMGGEGAPPEPLAYIDTCTAQTSETALVQRLGYVVLRNISISASAELWYPVLICLAPK